jgi:hypothetical protein
MQIGGGGGGDGSRRFGCIVAAGSAVSRARGQPPPGTWLRCRGDRQCNQVPMHDEGGMHNNHSKPEARHARQSHGSRCLYLQSPTRCRPAAAA